MKRTQKFKVRSRNYFCESFDSVEEFYQVAAGEVTKELTHYSRYTITHYNEDHEDFVGMKVNEIIQNKYGYKEGVEALKALPELNIKKGGVVYAHKWDDNDGDDMSMERYYDGMACMRKRYKTANKTQSGRFVEVKINVVENCNVHYQSMLFKTFTACRIVDQLESAGIRVRVTLSMRSAMRDDKGTLSAVDITVKDFNQPLNIALLANVCSPWFFRYWSFLYFAKTFELNEEGIAQARTFEDFGWESDKGIGDRKDMILIDSGQCLSQYSAEAFIKALEI